MGHVPEQSWGRKGALRSWLLPNSPVHPSPVSCGPQGKLCLQGAGGTQALLGVGGTHQAARGGRTGAGQRFWCSVRELGGDASSMAELCPFGFREGGC